MTGLGRIGLLLIFTLLGLSACGGGGGSDGGNSNPPPDTTMDWDQDNWDEEDWG